MRSARPARRFDAASKPYGLTNGQFSLMMALNRPEPPRVGDLAAFLAMDRTMLTAASKPLQRRGLVEVLPDARDRRERWVRLTDDGRLLLVEVVPVWRETHDQMDREIGATETLCETLRRISNPPLEEVET